MLQYLTDRDGLNNGLQGADLSPFDATNDSLKPRLARPRSKRFDLRTHVGLPEPVASKHALRLSGGNPISHTLNILRIIQSTDDRSHTALRSQIAQAADRSSLTSMYRNAAMTRPAMAKSTLGAHDFCPSSSADNSEGGQYHSRQARLHRHALRAAVSAITTGSL